MNIGVFVDSFRKPIPEALKLAAELGAQSFQVFITKGPMLAANMSTKARADFVNQYRDMGLQLSATCGDVGLKFSDNEALKEKESFLRDAVTQTVDLGATIMTTHIGMLGHDPDGSKEETMVANLKRWGEFAADHGVVLATETGLEPGERLRRILERANTKGIGVNFDPANLVMKGFDHLAAVRELFPFIVHTHAKDGVLENGKGREVPLGDGTVDFPAYARLLTELGYNGAYTIEREVGDDPVGDIRKAIAFLDQLGRVLSTEKDIT